jgi:hypothetical protein
MAGPWRVRTSKPKGNARVNLAHSLARNIAFFYFEGVGGAAGTFYDAVTGKRHGTASGITQSANGLSFNGAASAQGTAFSNPYGADTTQTTVIARVRPTVKPASKAIFVEFGASGGSRGACLVVDSNGFLGGGGLGSGGEVIQYDATDHTNQWVTVGGSGDGSSSPNGKAWVNGVSTGVNIGGGSFSGQAIAEVSLGRQNSGYFQFLTGDIEFVIGFTRILSDAEHRAIARNPWQLLAPVFDARLLSLPGAGGSGITGAASITEADDTVAATAALAIQGSASITEAGDTAAAAGAVKIQAAASITEGGDTSTATATLKVQGAAAITEGDDTSAASAALKIQGALSKTEDDDTLLATGSSTASTSGTADITEADDAVLATAVVKIAGAAAITEAGDTVSATAALKIAGAASLTEGDDTASAAAKLKISAAAAVTEGDDTSAATGALKIAGAASITEAGDTLSATGINPALAPLTSDPVFTVRIRVPRRSIVCSRRRIARAL